MVIESQKSMKNHVMNQTAVCIVRSILKGLVIMVDFIQKDKPNYIFLGIMLTQEERPQLIAYRLHKQPQFLSFRKTFEIYQILGLTYIIIFQVSMSHRSNARRKGSETSQVHSLGSESSSSNFSLSKTRKNQRRSNKKKITKIVHTFCFIQTGRNGQNPPIYFQQTGETAFRDPNSIKNLVFRQLNDASPQMIQNAKRNTGLTEKQQEQILVKKEVEFVFPTYQAFQPTQFYYIF